MNVDLSVDVAEAITKLKSHLEGDDFILKRGHDFNYFNNVMKGIDRDVTEHFAPNFNTLLPAQSFWIMLIDKAGHPVSTVASRMEPFAYGQTVSDYLKAYLPRVYFTEHGAPVELLDRQASFCEEATGKVVYLGEAWANEEHRRGGLTGNMVKLIQLISLYMFHPDYLYCWIRPKHAQTGFPQACGYKEIFPRAIRWRTKPALPGGDPDKDLRDLWLAGNRSGGLRDLADDVLAEHGASGYAE
ncbi:hypothetical protein IWQ49_006407 [Labrenzia sp. EL_126]|nr:hypothetical protein [Labrenzia sp. EL_126]